MLTGILLTVLYGAVWGVLWGGLDAICILKGFMAGQEPIWQIIRSFLTMLVASFITTLLLGGGNSIIAMIVALVAMYYSRPWVLQRWRW
jgi:hypothetical protein